MELTTPLVMCTLGVLVLKEVFGVKKEVQWLGVLPGIFYGGY
jgi:hypothetical protein